MDPTRPPFTTAPSHCSFKRHARSLLSLSSLLSPLFPVRFKSLLSLSRPVDPSPAFGMKSPRTSPLPLQSDSASGCLSGALRLLLCAGSPGSDYGESDVPRMLLRQQQKGQHRSPPTPGIVARLMGLDSMPVFPYMTPPPPPPPEASLSLSRSRSTSSAESWAGLMGEDSAVRGRRTSASFREAPTYLRQENEDFFVLSFAPEDAGSGAPRERNSSVLKKEKNSAERKKGGHKAAVAPPSKEAAARRRPSGVEKLEDKVKPPRPPPKQKQLPARKKIAATSQRKKNEAGCSSSEDTSPVSVLDYSISFKSSSSHPSEVERKQQRSRRKLSSKFENLSSNSPTTRSHDEPASIKKSSNGDRAGRDWSQIWGKICALTEQEAKISTTWTGKEISRSEEARDIAAALAVDVLDLVLHEAVAEISSSDTNSK